MQKPLNSTSSEGFLDAHVIGCTKHLSPTHHVFDQLKIVIMGNCYGVLRAFLLEPAQ